MHRKEEKIVEKVKEENTKNKSIYVNAEFANVAGLNPEFNFAKLEDAKITTLRNMVKHNNGALPKDLLAQLEIEHPGIILQAK